MPNEVPQSAPKKVNKNPGKPKTNAQKIAEAKKLGKSLGVNSSLSKLKKGPNSLSKSPETPQKRLERIKRRLAKMMEQVKKLRKEIESLTGKSVKKSKPKYSEVMNWNEGNYYPKKKKGPTSKPAKVQKKKPKWGDVEDEW